MSTYRWIYRAEAPGTFGRTLLSHGVMPTAGETHQEVAARVASMVRTGHAYTGHLVVTVWVGPADRLRETPPADARTFRYRDSAEYAPATGPAAPGGNSMVIDVRVEGRTVLSTTVEQGILKQRINGGDGELLRVVYRETRWEDDDDKPPAIFAARLVLEELPFPPTAGEGDPQVTPGGLPGGGK